MGRNIGGGRSPWKDVIKYRIQCVEEYNYRCGMKSEWPEIMRIVPIDKDGFPIKLGGEINERK